MHECESVYAVNISGNCAVNVIVHVILLLLLLIIVKYIQ